MQIEFSPAVRRVLAAARADAARRGHGAVGTFHVLHAITVDSEGEAELAKEGLAAAVVQYELDVLLSAGENAEIRGLMQTRPSRSVAVPYTTDVKKTIERAMNEARGAGQFLLEHMLVGLATQAHSAAAIVLRGLGVPPDATVSQDVQMRAQAVTRLTVRIDDNSDQSLREQIVTQITEAVATGTLQPGDRLPPVRELADQADIAPGTVAKAYSELEQRGVLETQGTRGTRVSLSARHVPTAERVETLVGLLRPIVVAAYHLGVTSDEARLALETAMDGVLLN